MKRKAVRASLRKESTQFPGYFKYELDIQEEDGSITKNVPAYGKDLQDALYRTVKVEKIERIEKNFNKMSIWPIMTIFMVYMTAIAITAIKLNTAWPVIVGLATVTAVVLGINHFLDKGKIYEKRRNR